MPRLRTLLAVGVVAFAFAQVEPCSAQSVQLPATRSTNVESGSYRHHHHHSYANGYNGSSAAYYPYNVPYSYGFGAPIIYPYRIPYANYGYPINLNSGLERGYRYGNTYINPNFGN